MVAREEHDGRPLDRLICGEIAPLLPNLSAADRQLLRAAEARPQALAMVIRAGDELLTGHRPALALNAGAGILEPSPPPVAVPPGPDAPVEGRKRRKPVAITAALLTLALVAALVLWGRTETATHVATHVATKASTPTEAATALPSVSTSTPPPSVDSSATTVPDASADGAGSDVVVPSLPGAPPAPSADCPAGKVTAVVSQVQAQQSPSDPTGWDVIVRGTLTNGTATPIVAPTVKVTITTSSGDEPAYGDTTNGDLAAGQSVDWSANSYVSSSTKPTATAQPDRWAWADPKYGECPSSGDQGASTAR